MVQTFPFQTQNSPYPACAVYEDYIFCNPSLEQALTLTLDTWQKATTQELVPTRVCEDTLAFMFHISVPLLLTEWALKSPVLHPTDPMQLAEFKGHFLDHLEEINKKLASDGRPTLGETRPVA